MPYLCRPTCLCIFIGSKKMHFSRSSLFIRENFYKSIFPHACLLIGLKVMYRLTCLRYRIIFILSKNMHLSRSSFFIREKLTRAREPNTITAFVFLSTRMAMGTRVSGPSNGSLSVSLLPFCRVYATEQQVIPNSIAAMNPEAGLKPAALLGTLRALITPFGQRESFERAMVAMFG